MTSGDEAQRAAQGPRSVRLAELGTALSRARCTQPSQLARMKRSLSQHGQLTPVIAVDRAGALEIVDGFKRRAAAAELGWGELSATVSSLDERAQWAAMLTLNRTPGALSVLEEALVMRELVQVGLSQAEVAQVVGRHRSWVSRRLGLLERLHRDLVEWVRTGLMTAGTARRLIVLPAGNQLELAAVVSKHSLSTEETELLVSLWRKATDAEVRRFLLAQPREALERARPEKGQSPPDPRLSAQGQVLWKALPILRGVAVRVEEALGAQLPALDLDLLKAQLQKTERQLPGLLETVGSAAKCACSGGCSATSATPASGDCSPTGMGSKALPERPAST
jgi:ParB/RepB/Spo0J family partition protein